MGYGISIYCGEEIATFPHWKLGEYPFFLGLVGLFFLHLLRLVFIHSILRCHCHTKHSYTWSSTLFYTSTHIPSLSLFSWDTYFYNDRPACCSQFRAQVPSWGSPARGAFGQKCTRLVPSRSLHFCWQVSYGSI